MEFHLQSFIIGSFNFLLNVFVVASLIGSVFVGLAVGQQAGGGFMSLLVIAAMFVAVILSAGGLYLLLGIYENTGRTARATEALRWMAEDAAKKKA